MAGTEWEYNIVELPGNITEATKLLSALGKDHWELVEVVHMGFLFVTFEIAYLKRIKTD